MATPLSDIEIHRQLSTLTGWARRGNEIVRTYEFATFGLAIAFVDRIAPIADAHNHHPDIDIRYNKVIVHLSTHDAGGITGNDFRLAKAIDDA
ncbi:MAG: 4a-hydroxytetrahydrobiopterin dehydratase [Gemmatimonadaceae bacterium]